jgi:hypothetical protein
MVTMLPRVERCGVTISRYSLVWLRLKGRQMGMEILFVEVVQMVVLLIVGLGVVLTLKY